MIDKYAAGHEPTFFSMEFSETSELNGSINFCVGLIYGQTNNRLDLTLNSDEL